MGPEQPALAGQRHSRQCEYPPAEVRRTPREITPTQELRAPRAIRSWCTQSQTQSRSAARATPISSAPRPSGRYTTTCPSGSGKHAMRNSTHAMSSSPPRPRTTRCGARRRSLTRTRSARLRCLSRWHCLCQNQKSTPLGRATRSRHPRRWTHVLSEAPCLPQTVGMHVEGLHVVQRPSETDRAVAVFFIRDGVYRYRQRGPRARERWRGLSLTYIPST
ncbi:hypothetical protein C8Q74DRAFT_508527 [Fomes fomentarius]|nr:hypothetical protein C8Q74DRAFT_508527 [Fomes fomentarius]